jgi:DNA modification methylase
VSSTFAHSPPLPPNYKSTENGVYVTDIWDDIRELTSGYFAGDEAIRLENGERFHKQQSPIALLLRIILSSTQIGDTVFDPFAGTGTTLVTAYQ